jgi:hypothetical protein
VPESTPPPSAESLREHLERLKRLRGQDAAQGPPARLAELKLWQSERLARTYADLAATPRYAKPTRFFLDDLYGPKDFSVRDTELLKIYPMLVRMLPATAVQTAALAIEVDALSEELDHRLATALPAGPLDEQAYGKAYRESGTPAQRERQIALVGEVGRRLDLLVTKPMLLRTLRMMRTPARLAGFADVQGFLERGFEAFRAMGGAEEFLDTIAARERAIASRLFSSAPAPFSV